MLAIELGLLVNGQARWHWDKYILIDQLIIFIELFSSRELKNQGKQLDVFL